MLRCRFINNISMLPAAKPASLSLFRRLKHMTNVTTIGWRLGVIAHTDRMVEAAMDEIGDANEARWLVHRVMLNAMHEMDAPAHRRDLDTALGQALRAHADHAA